VQKYQKNVKIHLCTSL